MNPFTNLVWLNLTTCFYYLFIYLFIYFFFFFWGGALNDLIRARFTLLTLKKKDGGGGGVPMGQTHLPLFKLKD